MSGATREGAPTRGAAPHARLRARHLSARAALAAAVALTGHAAQAEPIGDLLGDGASRFDGIGADNVPVRGNDAVVIGDFDGDGIDDFAIGAPRNDLVGFDAGNVYVIYGDADGFPAVTDVEAPGFSGVGFRIDGPDDGGWLGYAVAAAGDVNDDGFDDLAISAPVAQVDGDPDPIEAGSVWILYGHARPAAPYPTLSLPALPADRAVRFDGIAAGDRTGFALSGAGDLNDDGFDDLAIGAPFAAASGIESGRAYVVFGSASLPAVTDLAALDGSDGFRLDGEAAFHYAGDALGAAGDVDVDGVDDLLIGAEGAGLAYIVLGGDGPFPAQRGLGSLTAAEGVRIAGSQLDHAGDPVTGVGDFNGDGIDDFAIGAREAAPGGLAAAGSAYLLFGRAGGFPGGSIDLAALGNGGVRFDGVAENAFAGRAVAGDGDLNDDGFTDLAIGATRELASSPGRVYVIFGRSTPWPESLPLDDPSIEGRWLFDGEVTGDRFGWRLSLAGDVDNDGNDDLLIGAPQLGDSAPMPFSAYIVYGIGAPTVIGGPLLLADVFEDGDPAGTTLGPAVDAHADGFTPQGAAITQSPAPGGGVWQFRFDAGGGWQAVPADLAIENALLLGRTSQIRFVPAPDYHGSVPALALRLWTGGGGFAPGAGLDLSGSVGGSGPFASDDQILDAMLAVLSVNDAPSFVADDPPLVLSTIGDVVREGWAQAEPGAANEAGQTFTYQVVSNDNAALFAQPPTVDADGTLRYRPQPGTSGQANVGIRVIDSGGTANGGVDASPTQVFTFRITGEGGIFCDGFEDEPCGF